MALASVTLSLLATVALAVVVPNLGPNDNRGVPSASAIRAGAPLANARALPAVDSVKPTPDSIRLDSAPQDSARQDSGRVVPAPRDTVVAAAPSAAPPPTRVATPPSPRTGTQPDPISRTPTFTRTTRWATNLWVNVRDGPANEAVIVGILRPGQQVEAGAPTWDGWQLVYVDGKRMGYVARSLLTSRPLNQ